MDMIITRDEWTWWWRMDVITTWRMDMIITRDEWTRDEWRIVIITRDEWTWLLHVTNGHDYNTWRMDVIITRDEWMWL